MNALIANDDAAMSEMISRCLSIWGWTADQSHSASSAFALFQRHKYDLAVCDVDLPGGNGIVLAQTLLKATPSLRIAIVSGDPGNLIAARQAGFSRCLRKPFDLGELQGLLDLAALAGKSTLDVAESVCYKPHQVVPYRSSRKPLLCTPPGDTST